jgi:hypothetical protein
MRSAHFVVGFSLVLAELIDPSFPRNAGAQSGVAVTPDGLVYLVNKDLSGERWSISLNLSPEDRQRTVITNVTGNVFRPGQAPAFVVCQPTSDSGGTLSDPASTLRLSCDGAPTCASDALTCSQSDWTLLVRGLELPATFFLPGDEDPSVARAGLASVPQGVDDRGTTLSYDGLSYLVSKDIGNERWSIVVNLVPRRTADGSTRNELASVTGNVFNSDGTPPQFVYCTQNSSSAGDLGDPASTFRLRCLGANACTQSPTECAAQGWTLISDSVELTASFLLPGGGSGIPRSDPEIVIIGRTSDPPSIATDEFDLDDDRTATVRGGSCSGSCRARQIGGCSSVAGRLVEIDSRCLCEVDEVAASCITCGSGAAGTCGKACDYAVGSRTARGLCLPFDALGGGCLCSAVGADGAGLPSSCGGALAVQCGGEGQCCVDDPADGCDPSSGDTACAGRCASTVACDPAAETCGICADPCGNGSAEGLEACDGADLRGATCESRGLGGGSLGCRADCTYDTKGCSGTSASCGDGRVDPGESCDGGDLAGSTCESLGFDRGSLACSSSCGFDTGGCTNDQPPSAAPRVTSFVCNGSASCSLPPATPFDLSFSYTDDEGDAVRYQLYLDGSPFYSDSVSGGASGEVSVTPSTGVCPNACCVDTTFRFTVTVEDARGNVSDPAGPLEQTTEFSAACF